MSVLAGCALEPDPVAETADDVLMRDDLLVPIARNLDGEAVALRHALLRRSALRSAPPTDFYLAIRKDALEQRWFWSVYLEELQPYGPSPATLGTRVVRFREQNGNLYVFDADDRRATSDIFNPDLIVDAFPIVDSSHFDELPGADNYLLVDPAAGLNRFNALSDSLAMSAIPLAVELSFVRSFHRTPDGGRFEQIITAYGDQPLGVPGDVERNELRLAATLGVNLRRYTESPDYTPVLAPPVTHYFLSDPANVPNTGQLQQYAVHWNFHRGMTPIRWLISPSVLDIAADPSLGGADIFAAMKRGIESWNDVFGYPVFTAELATEDDSFADDRVNYVIVDPDTSRGYAYADWRTNPNTGEIRGASVYFGGGFFLPMPDDATATAASLTPSRAKTERPGLVWQDLNPEPLCVLWAPPWQRPQAPWQGEATLTGAQKLEVYIQHVIAHEIGHTLGLRHNFKGSLVPPTSSVMEYSLLDDAIAQPTPGTYDRQAIAYLYGQSPNLPAAPFCTDEHTWVDPNCVPFDSGSPTPLDDYQIAGYTYYTTLLFDGIVPPETAEPIVTILGAGLLGYARAGTPGEAMAAWTAALDGARAPLDPAALASNPYLGPAANALSAAVFHAVSDQPAAAIQTPFSDPATIAMMAHDAENILANLDGVRSFETRRVVIDALAKAQKLDAYLALLSARDAIATQLAHGGLNTADEALTRDLLARIDAAISPYFQ